jgi:hypothetical protein
VLANELNTAEEGGRAETEKICDASEALQRASLDVKVHLKWDHIRLLKDTLRKSDGNFNDLGDDLRVVRIEDENLEVCPKRNYAMLGETSKRSVKDSILKRGQKHTGARPKSTVNRLSNGLSGLNSEIETEYCVDALWGESYISILTDLLQQSHNTLADRQSKSIPLVPYRRTHTPFGTSLLTLGL